MQHKQSSALLAVLFFSILTACNKTETSTANSTDAPATKTDTVAPESAPQSQVITENRRVTGTKFKETRTDTVPAVTPPSNPDAKTAANTNPTVARKTADSKANSADGGQDPRLKGRIELADGSADAAKPDNSAGDPIAGREKSQLCQGCHGEDGIGLEPLIPNLAGQYGKYLVKQIHDYQTGARKHQIMSAMAKTVSDCDLADIAAYFSSRNKMTGSGAGNPIGENIFLNGNSSKTLAACIKCHGVKGKGLTPNSSLFPVIGGQHKEYLRKQLGDFRGRIRLNSPGQIMNNITKSLTDAEIEALADYISAQ